MEFVSGRQFSRDEIFQVYGIPSGMMNANSTEANARTARETFLEDTIWPALVRFAAKLTAELAPFWGSDLVIKPVDVRPRDELALRREIFSAGQFLTVNEMRQKYYHLGPVAWGDKPMAMVLAESKAESARSGAPTGFTGGGDTQTDPVDGSVGDGAAGM